MLASSTRSTPFAAPLGVGLHLLLAGLMAVAGVLLVTGTARAADVTLEASAMLGGHVRPGAWAAVSVTVRNAGPTIDGELRVRSSQQGASRFGVAVQLAPDATQEHTLYVQPPMFGTRLTVELVSGENVLVTAEVPIKSHDSHTPIVAIVAERPEGFTRDVANAVSNSHLGSNPSVITLRASDLPPRVEAWSAIDRLVWQDVDFSQLDPEQQAALRLWIGAGGRLVVVGGTTGVGPLASLPADMLPFRAERTIDVPTSDLPSLLGTLPAGATSLPAIAGTLERGAVLARSGDHVYAADASYGQGGVTMIGVDPATHWLAGTDAAGGLWRRALPLAGGVFVKPFIITDEYVLQSALYNLPSVALPPIEQLFVLLLAYIALIGPINYLVLRRIDRREWAWLTMPLLVAVFAVGSYGLGAALKGSDVIVNQIAVVRAGQSTETGIGQVYVGVFSPSRRTFDVRIPGGPLLSTPVTQTQVGSTEQAIDALIGVSASRLRNFEVGFGVVRGFRADMETSAPRVTADLQLVEGRLRGSVTNDSDAALENIGIAFGGGVMVIERLEAGATAEVEIRQHSSTFGFSIADRIFGNHFPPDAEGQRRQMTRRSVVEAITGYGNRIQGTALEVPVLLGWRSGPIIDVLLAGERANQVGDSLFVVPLAVTYASQAVFDDALISKALVESDVNQGWADGNGFYMDRGTMVIEARPAGLSGTFRATSLELALTQGGVTTLRGNGQSASPLPDDQQPDQEDPIGKAAAADCFQPPCDDAGGAGGDDPAKPEPAPGEWRNLPALQLYDHQQGRWYEFAEMQEMNAYLIDDPQRWIDAAGRLLVRLVNRNAVAEQQWFQLLLRMEGTIE